VVGAAVVVEGFCLGAEAARGAAAAALVGAAVVALVRPVVADWVGATVARLLAFAAASAAGLALDLVD
jgi:hypothetical protein